MRNMNPSIVIPILMATAALLAACPATAPKYYDSIKTDEQDKLNCFNDLRLPFYSTRSLRPDPDTSGGRLHPKRTIPCDQDRLCLAVERVNKIFANERGIYHELFANPFTGRQDDRSGIHMNEECENDPPFPGRQVAVSAFAMAPAIGASEKIPDGKTGPEKAGASAEKRGGTTNKKAGQVEAQADGGGNPGMLLTQTVTLVMSSYLYSLLPADRLDKVYALITPIDTGVEFVSLEKTVFDAEMADFGKYTTQRSLSFSALPLGILLGQGINVTPSANSTLDKSPTRRYVTQNVEIFPLRNVLLMSKDGGPAKADIAGNDTVTLTLKVPSHLCRYLRVRSANVELDTKTSIPLKTRNLCRIERLPAIVAWVAIVRGVDNRAGQRTVSEDDDDIRLLPFKGQGIIDLWNNPADLFGVDVGDQAVLEGPSSNENQRLLFGSLDDAMNFRALLGAELEKGGADHGDPLASLKKQLLFTTTGAGKNCDMSGHKGNCTVTICAFRTPPPNLIGQSIPSQPGLCGPVP